MQICNDCHAGCCRRFSTQISGYDIIKIRRNLDLEYLHFLQVTPVDDEYVEKDAKKIGVFKFTNIGKNEYYTFYLRSVKSTYMPDTLKCMFLHEWDNKDLMIPGKDKLLTRCGIYESRPLTCSIYPTKLHENGLIALSKKNPAKNLSEVGNPVYEICPEELGQDDIACNSDRIVKDLIMYEYEMKYFKFLAEVWNKGDCDFGEFFDFLESAYKNRILVEE